MTKVETYPRYIHLCIPIDRAIQELKKGNNVLKCTPGEALIELTQAKAEGKTFYSGCDNMSAEGRCDGHAAEVVWVIAWSFLGFTKWIDLLNGTVEYRFIGYLIKK